MNPELDGYEEDAEEQEDDCRCRGPECPCTGDNKRWEGAFL